MPRTRRHRRQLDPTQVSSGPAELAGPHTPLGGRRRGLRTRLEDRVTRRYVQRMAPAVLAGVAVAVALVGLAFVLGVAIGSAMVGGGEEL